MLRKKLIMIETLLGIDTWEFNRLAISSIACAAACTILIKLFSKTTDSQ
jgi:hypothetical protein